MSRQSSSAKCEGRNKGEPREPRFEPLVVTVQDAMDLLGDSRSTIYRKIKQRLLKSFRDGGRRKISFESVKAAAEPP